GTASQHLGILQNFANAILKGEKLISPAIEGIHSVELANSVLYSAWQGQSIDLPLDSKAYEKELQERIDTSTFKKREPRKTGPATDDDFAKSF
ncbi:MAG: gfo/Idh/MocA family oxidoreductase, partial [Verrucomicrobiota bacterium]